EEEGWRGPFSWIGPRRYQPVVSGEIYFRVTGINPLTAKYQFAEATNGFNNLEPRRIPMKEDIIVNDTSRDGIDRRGFLKCMGWAGTATVWSLAGGVFTPRALADALSSSAPAGDFNFVQISDSHIG